VSGASIRAIIRMAYGRGSGRFIGVLGAFFDDSGTHSDSTLTVIGGLLGTEEQWDVFEAAWNGRLADPLPDRQPLPYFHLSECRARHGLFYDYSQAEVDHITYLFRRIILDIGFVTIASAVNKKAWNELNVGELRDAFGDSVEFCFWSCINDVTTTIRFRKPREMVHMFVDEAMLPALGSWANLYELLRNMYPEINGIGFAPVKKVVALQGADIIATETYQYGLEWLRNRHQPNTNPHFREFLKRELSVGRILDHEHIQEAIDRFRASSSAPRDG
jgi:hypothetical protein